MDHTSGVSPLKERASIQLAINFCQTNSFKEAALYLEKPTYGYFLPDESIFVSDQREYSIWTAKQKDMSPFAPPTYPFLKEQNDAAIAKECQRLIEKLPSLLRDRVRVWIHRIALQYLSYAGRMEALFRVSRYCLMTIFSIGDWKETGQLDEEKVALRLLEDERLTVFQKYQIACVYCLHEHIPELWKILTKDEVSLITKDLERFRERIRSDESTPYKDYEMHISVLLWSYQMEGDQKEKLTESELWVHAARQATYYGNRAALVRCWERLNEQTRKQIVIEIALISVKECDVMCTWEKYGCENELHFPPSMAAVELAKEYYNLRSYYGELVLFFLSQMDEEQKLTFFQRTIGVSHYYDVLKCFFDWPLQHELLPTINRLWEIIPKHQYLGHLFNLMGRDYTSSSKEIHVDDYRSVFWKLWETAPEEFKLFVFRHDIGYMVLFFLLLRGFFRKDDEALFKRSFCDQTQKAKRRIIHSETGEYLCSKLLDEENLSFLNWILEKCLSKEEFPSVKRKIIYSEPGCRSCVSKLADNRGNFVQDVIDWCFDTDSEKAQFKRDLIHPKNLDPPDPKVDFAKVERVINFCVPSDEMKKEIMTDFALYFCKKLLEKYESGRKGAFSITGATIWEQMDKILSWSLASDEKIRNIKKDLSENAINLHFKIVFDNTEWEEVERFYKWFDLSPVEIKDLKHTIFNPDLILKIQSYLFTAGVLVAPLRWCLTDEETVMRFKKTLEGNLCGLEESEAAKERLNYLVSELLGGLRVEEPSRRGE